MIQKEKVEKFRASLHGQFIQPGDARYDDERKVWNGMIDRRPSMIVRCADKADVISCINFARTEKLLVAVRGGGHNVAGFGTCDDGIVIDLSQMKKIEVDIAAHTARAQAGLTWGEFDKATQSYHLATTGGLVSTTGIAGFTLGGGFGWLVRKYGLAVDNLLSVDMILANGQQLTASPTENADLFWGVRGGGGNFGVVTSFQFRLHDLGPLIYGGAIFHSAEKSKDLLRFYRGWTPALPDELSTMVIFLTAPPAPFVPKDLVGTPMIAVAFCYSGLLNEGEQVVKPLYDFATPAIDLAGPMPYLDLQSMFDATGPKGIHAYWKTEYLNNLGDDVVDVLVGHSSKMSTLSCFTAVHIHHWGGAIKRVDTDGSAFAHRNTPYVLNIIGLWPEHEEADKHITWTRDFARAIQPMSTGQVYLNFLGSESEARIKAAYDPVKYERLVALKNKYDPANLFRLNQNIKPSAE